MARAVVRDGQLLPPGRPRRALDAVPLEET